MKLEIKFTKKNPEGKVIPQTYYTDDYQFEIEKGTIGWNVNKWVKYPWFSNFEYSFSCETLKEAKESIINIYKECIDLCDIMCS